MSTFCVQQIMAQGTNGAKRLRGNLEGKVKAQEAREMGMTRQTLDHILKGRRRPTIDQAVAIRRRHRIPISAWMPKDK